jgi:hypothetical protein
LEQSANAGFATASRGFRCAVVAICDADVRSLVEQGYLDRLQQDDSGNIQTALSRLLDQVSPGRRLFGPFV